MNAPILQCKTRAELERATNWLTACGLPWERCVAELTLTFGADPQSLQSAPKYRAALGKIAAPEWAFDEAAKLARAALGGAK